ncbi:MAG: hypothetical protein ACRDJF_01530 [Actinomycetota bacterium]
MTRKHLFTLIAVAAFAIYRHPGNIAIVFAAVLLAFFGAVVVNAFFPRKVSKHLLASLGIASGVLGLAVFVMAKG